MKIPKTKKMYCKKCKAHTEHKVREAKKRTPFTAHTLSYGSKPRAKKRGAMGLGSRGRYSKPPLSKFKMTGKKQSKKVDLRYTCTKCKKTSTQGKAWRAKRVEFK